MIERKKNLDLDEIISIEDMGTIDTYDFSIADTHCFFANGVLVHNTGALEEIADIAILLHWNWKYTNKPDDFHKYKLFISKNRNGATGYCDLYFEPENYAFYDLEKKER